MSAQALCLNRYKGEAACRWCHSIDTRSLFAMPRWVWVLIIILVIIVFVFPDPTGAGAAVGNAFDALVAFFRSAGETATS